MNFKKLTAALLCGCLFTLGSGSPILAKSDSPVSTTVLGGMNGGMVSGNSDSNYGRTPYSYLFETANGYSRIERNGASLQVEEYSRQDQLLSSRTITLGMPIFGSVAYANGTYYVLSGQENKEENPDKPVVCLEKYSSDWKLLKKSTGRLPNVTEPFHASGTDMIVQNGLVYVNMARLMYTSEKDGLNHQAALTLIFDEGTLALHNDQYDDWDPGYVSHSFQGYVRSDGDYLYRVNLGDGYPRAVSICRTPWDAQVGSEAGQTTSLFEIPGGTGDNYTGVMLGGFELSSAGSITLGNSIDQQKRSQNRNIFTIFASPDLSETNVNWLTDYPADTTARNMRMVKISSNKFLVMWNEIKNERFVAARLCMVNGRGEAITEIKAIPQQIYEAQPKLFSDGTVRWLSSGIGSSASIYRLNASRFDELPTEVVIESQDMFRLYNPNSGEHFYTASANERDTLASIGWKYEGTAWKAPVESSRPVYRLYNPNAGDHHYTTDQNEKKTLCSLGWKDEGTGWYSDESEGQAIYRLYNPNAKTGTHHYTADYNEYMQLSFLGWIGEWVAWHGLR